MLVRFLGTMYYISRVTLGTGGRWRARRRRLSRRYVYLLLFLGGGVWEVLGGAMFWILMACFNWSLIC